MGFTLLDGIAMCTRSGALDPGINIAADDQYRWFAPEHEM